MRTRFAYFFFLLLTTTCCTTGDDDDSTGGDASHTPDTKPSEQFRMTLVGESWGVTGDGSEVYYPLDAEGCSGHAGKIIIWDSSDLPATVDCSTVGYPVDFTLDLSNCENLPEYARIEVAGCDVVTGDADTRGLSITLTHTEGGSSSDVYGTVDFGADLQHDSILDLSGQYSHCLGGEPCEIEPTVGAQTYL